MATKLSIDSKLIERAVEVSGVRCRSSLPAAIRSAWFN
jgi:hypothetical protein